MSGEHRNDETLIEHFENCVPGGREALLKAREEQRERSRVPKLVGTTEAAAILGVARQRVTSLWKEHPRFPEPVEELRCGPVWLEKHIREFAKIPRPDGRPRKEKE